MHKWMAVLAAMAAAPLAAEPAGRTLRLSAALEAARADEAQPVWVFFRDKGEAAAPVALTPRALARRQARGALPIVTSADVPVAPAYLSAVAGIGRVRHASRWFNAVSVDATPGQVEALAALPFVERLDLVARFRRQPEPADAPAEGNVRTSRQRTPAAIDYGPSLGQLEQIGVPTLHRAGYDGTGVLIAVFDAGFDNLGHEAFASTKIVAQYDFVNGDLDVANGSDRGQGSHGTNTLSVIGGYREGMLVGPAYGATYMLGKTEDTTRETPVEEDHWAAAAEWAEAAGADVISSSLGYLDYDAGFRSLTARELDGDTAVSTRAADLAAERGVVVVNSAGNSGFDATHNTLGAPADGHGVIAAGAVDASGARASFSSVGPSADGRIKPDVSAQGVAVVAAGSPSRTSYRLVNGTSFSCPLTAGVAALLVQIHPTRTAAEIRDAMRASGSQAAAPDNLLGYGIVDAVRAAASLSGR
ncbi:MAG: S8 family serine peptidase [Vicinamibacteria bacterium]